MHRPDILILTDNPFPDGNAGTNRIKGYISGFSYHNINVDVVIFRPTQYSKHRTNPSSGYYRSTHFVYPGIATIRKNYFIHRRINNLVGFIFSYCYVIFRILREKNTKILFYGEYQLYEAILIFSCRLLRVEIYKEINEHPQCIGVFSTKFRRKLYAMNIQGYTGLIVMTRSLKQFFEEKLKLKNKLISINNFTERSRFDQQNISNVGESEKYIFVSGCLKDSKDGIISFLPVFSNVNKIYNDLKLKIAAYGNSEQIRVLKDYIIKNNMENEITYLGEISQSDLAYVASNAYILINPRPPGMQSEYGFPTKLVEFLNCKKPVISSSTGDISFFFTDMKDCLLYKPGDLNELEEKIKWVMLNYKTAMKIASEGAILANNYFDPAREVEKLISCFG